MQLDTLVWLLLLFFLRFRARNQANSRMKERLMRRVLTMRRKWLEKSERYMYEVQFYWVKGLFTLETECAFRVRYRNFFWGWDLS